MSIIDSDKKSTKSTQEKHKNSRGSDLDPTNTGVDKNLQESPKETQEQQKKQEWQWQRILNPGTVIILLLILMGCFLTIPQNYGFKLRNSDFNEDLPEWEIVIWVLGAAAGSIHYMLLPTNSHCQPQSNACDYLGWWKLFVLIICTFLVTFFQFCAGIFMASQLEEDWQVPYRDILDHTVYHN